MDAITVRVLDSARSHGRALATITGMLDRYATDIYPMYRDSDETEMTFRAPSGQRMMFERITGRRFQLKLYHVDLTATERSAQMTARYH